MNRSLMVLTMVVVAGRVMFGQAPAIQLTLDDAISRGLAASHRVAEIGARQEAALAIEGQRKAAARPQASVLTEYSRTNHVEEFGIPGGRLIYPDIPDNLRSRVDLHWSIYNGGRNAALTRAAAAEAGAIAQDRDALRADLKLEITRAYWAVITSRASEDVVRQALARTEAHLVDVRNQLNVGLVPPSDVFSLEAQQAHQQMLVIDAENIADTAAADFRLLVGLGENAPFELADRLDAPAAPSPAASQLVETARANRAERRALENRISASGDRVSAALSGRLPVISTVGGYDIARPNPKIFPREAAWKPSWDVSVNLTWNVFDGGRVAGEIAEAEANRRAAEERLREFDVNVGVEVQERARDVAAAQAAIVAADAGVRSASEARRVIGERFSAGVATNTDVIDAQLALLQAELDRTRALANAHLAVARLDRALGR
jgi:outer membrane protein TolC